MKSTVKKIALSLLLAFGAIVLCVFGSNVLLKENRSEAYAAEAMVTATVTSDQTIVAPGETIVLKLKITTTKTGTTWSSITACLSALKNGTDRAGNAIQECDSDLATKFEFVEWEHNFAGFDDTASMYIETNSTAAKCGFNIVVADTLGTGISTSTPFECTVKLKVKDDAGSLGNIYFGIGQAKANTVNINNPAGGKSYTYRFDNTQANDSSATSPYIAVNNKQIRIGSVSSNANLSSVSVGHGSAGTNVTVADNMEYKDSDGTNRSNFKVKATVADSNSTIDYSIGTSTTKTRVASGSEFSVSPNLDSSGETTVKILVTAESGDTKNYTLKIVSSYARINAMTVAVQDAPSGITGLGFTSPTSFNKDTFTYSVKTAKNCAVNITPSKVADYGISDTISVTTSGCSAASSVQSGSPLSVTNITDGASVVLTATAKDGTTQAYTINFTVVNSDTSLSSFTMIEDQTGTTVNNDVVKAASASVDYYFLLSDASGFKGKFNIAATDSAAAIKVGTSNYNSATLYGAGDYNVTVQAQAGNTKVYKVKVVSDIKKGEIKDLQYAVQTNSGHTLLSSIPASDQAYDEPTNTYTYNVKVDLNTYPANTMFYLKGTVSAGATATASGINGSAGNWSKALVMGKNEYTLTANSTEGATIYKVNVLLVEDKNAITAVSIANGAGTNISGFAFSQGTYIYNITVPYKDHDKVNFTVTTDGKYTSVWREGTSNSKLSHTTNTTTHTLSNIALAAGDTTVISLHAQADDTLGDVGTTYVFNITREVADTDATLTALTVTIDGEVKSFKDDAVFNPNVTSYTIEIERPDSASSSPIVISATAKSASAGLTCNGVAMTGGISNQTFTYRTGEHSTDYKIIVTAESGASTTYTVTVKKIVPDPEFTDLQISYINDGNYESVLYSGDYDAATGTYSVTRNIADVPVNSKVYLKGTATKEATVTKSSNLTGSASPWNGSLAHGVNTFQLTVAANGKTKVYKIEIKLLENESNIENVTITLNGAAVDSNFSFSAGTPVYNLSVPYANHNTVVMTVTTSGYYTVVLDDANHKFDTTTSVKTNTISISLNPGVTTKIRIHTVADNNISGLPASSIGSIYEFNIERAAANSNAKLASLDVTVDGTPITFAEGMFDPDTLTYNYTIQSTGNSTAALVFTAAAASDKSTLKFSVDGAASTVMTNGISNQNFTFRDANYTVTYSVIVIPESGEANKVEYKVLVKRQLQKGDFEDIKLSTDNIFFDSVKSQFDTNNTYTVNYNISEVPVGSKLYIEANATADSTVSVTNLTKNGDKYEATLSKFGATTVKLTATSKSGKTDYVITINLIEDIDDISDVVVSGVDDFRFDPFETTYNLTVPFTVSNVTVGVTPEGTYGIVKKQGTTTDTKLTLNGKVYEEKVSLRAGDTTELKLYGVANEGRGKSDGTEKGTVYTFNITRGAADNSITLKTLDVTIGGKACDIKFDPSLNDYVVEIEKPENESSVVVDIKAEPTSDTSTVTGNTGANTFTFLDNREHETDYTVKVRSESGKENTYTIKVKRVIIAGDFETLEFAETGNNYEDVRKSSKYDELEMVYTVNLSLANVVAGTNVRIKAVPTSGATVTTTGNIKESASENIYLATLAAGRNEYTLSAKTATGEKTYNFVINLFEDKNKVEKIDVTAEGTPLSADVYKWVDGQTSYEITVPYTVKTVKIDVTTDGTETVVLDDDDNAFAKVATGNGRHHERAVELLEGRMTTVMFRAKSDKGEEGSWYEFRIMRESANSDASLKSLVVNVGGKPMPFNEGEFDPERLDYSILVEEGSSYNVNIQAEPNVSSTKVSGTGSKTFNFSDSTSIMSFPVTTTAEDGETRTYTVTISQKPIVLSSNYDITRIVINGTRDYYDDVPAAYNSEDPVKITVPYNQSKVKVVVTTALKATVVTEPALSSQGYLDLPEDSTVSLVVYAVAEDGTNVFGTDKYVFEITRERQGEVSGPDATVTLLNAYDVEKDYEVDIDSEETLVYVVDTYNHKIDMVDVTVDLLYGGTYEIFRVDSSSFTSVAKASSGKTRKIKLDYGTNVFSINMESSDGYSKKAVIFVFERERAALRGLSASAIASLRDDFDPNKDDYTYNVSSNVDYLGLDVDIDTSLYHYEFKGSEQLNYGANQVVIEIYENTGAATGRAASQAEAAPVRTITLNVTREKSNLFWIIMFVVLIVLVIAELIIILIVRRNKTNGPDEPTIIVTPQPAATQLPPPQQPIQPIIIQAPPQQPAQLPQQGQTTVYLPPQDPNNNQY